MLDSALTQLSETQYGEKANVIRDSFIRYLLDHQESGQVIFIDQKEKMPTWLDGKSKCKYHEFTKSVSMDAMACCLAYMTKNDPMEGPLENQLQKTMASSY